jgi:HSP20 family molecular chaperone IbpA
MGDRKNHMTKEVNAMSSVIRWSPISDLMSLHSAMDRLFGDTFGLPGQSRTVGAGAVGEGYLPLDVYQTDKEWLIRAAVPGVDPSTVEVTFDGGQINIKGEIKPLADARPEQYWLRENFYGKFSRQGEPAGRRAWRAGQGPVRQWGLDPDGTEGAAGKAEVCEDSDQRRDRHQQRAEAAGDGRQEISPAE